DRAREMATLNGELQRIGMVAIARAEAYWLAGDRDEALAEARVAYDLSLQKRHAWLAGELAYWLWKGGGRGAGPGWIAEPYALESAGEWRRAADWWRARGCPYEAARALAGGDDQAQQLAYEEFRQLGAMPDARRAAHSLRTIGASVPRGPRPST